MRDGGILNSVVEAPCKFWHLLTTIFIGLQLQKLEAKKV